jgi:hypothetical protein
MYYEDPENHIKRAVDNESGQSPSRCHGYPDRCTVTTVNQFGLEPARFGNTITEPKKQRTADQDLRDGFDIDDGQQ